MDSNVQGLWSDSACDSDEPAEQPKETQVMPVGNALVCAAHQPINSTSASNVPISIGKLNEKHVQNHGVTAVAVEGNKRPSSQHVDRVTKQRKMTGFFQRK